MPYFISDSNPDCSGWAVEKEDGEILGCHATKQEAIDQMVAVSIAEGLEPGGERTELRAVDVPAYIADAAARGLALRADGFGGDGLTEGTIREAREMADGTISDNKVIRANAWAARHAVDLEAEQNTNPNNDGWPGNGAVAHYLWGIDPTNPGPARRWFEREAARLQERAVMSDVEIRMFDTEPLELRDSSEGIGTFSGWAMRYGKPSLPLPFTEFFQPGAFTRSLKSRNDIRLYVNHDDRMVLASRRAKTLRLEDREEGLWVEADLPDTSYARDLRELMKRGDVHTQSIGFTAVRDEWSNDGAERRVTEARLHETSIVTGIAAYPSTSAAVRNIRLIAKRTQIDAEQLSDAISALEAGDIDAEQADILRTVVDRAAGIPEKTPTVPVSLLQKKLDLIAKSL